MKWNLAGLLALLVIDMRAPPADACGIKLVIKTQTPRKAVARSSNPSHLLLLGTPPHRLERELSAAGHDVEVAPTVAAAKQTTYSAVVVDSAQADEARAKFPGAVIIVRSGDVTADIGSVENQVARRPVRSTEPQPPIAARETRTPVRTGPGQAPTVVAKGPDTVEPPAAAPPPAPAPPKVAVAPKPPPVETRPPVPLSPPVPAPVTPPEKVAVARPPAPPPVERPPAPPPPAVVAPREPARFHGEVYFGYNSANLGNKAATLDRAVRWLTDSTDIHVVIEGYADPTGTHEANMVLGQSRAESVRDYLAAAGIDQARMEVVSFGDTRLKYGRTDSRNRRVAIIKK